MIPSTNNKLLVSEDWKKVYQSFRNADFKSYDFETLRRTMISYLRENYPEDFNDFIESSEYVALIELIAFLGQNLSFRIDLNARENFLETAERRDSILRLAQLISYIPKRNVPASGFLKILAVSTTDSVTDSSGINLANTTIGWNDSTNVNWYQQFTSILSSAMDGSFVFGKPYNRKTISGILTEQYQINSVNTDVPVFSFSKNINGTSMNFEIVSATMSNSNSVYEEPPRPANSFGLIYKNDNQGSSSVNTGFFVLFKQGTMGVANFNLTNPVPNEIVGINISDINDNDVWLWQLDSNNNYANLWSKVPAITGNNVIYNSLSKDERKVYSVTSRNQDQIDLNFSDGSFGDLPKGQFNLFYRQSNGLTYTIKPEQMTGIFIEVPYVNKSGRRHTLTLTLGLQYIVNNSSGTESNASIQNKAPQAFYVQNRMVTAEDYNIAPLTLSNDILKVKSVNRISSGISKYFDLSDNSGKYSKTSIFATDGILYKQTNELNFEFEFMNRNEALSAIKKYLEPVIASSGLNAFYLNNYPRPQLSSSVDEPDVSWTQVSKGSNESSGYFKIPETSFSPEEPLGVGQYSVSNLRYVTPGALIKFVPPNGKYFSSTGKIVSKQSGTTRKYIWVKVNQIIGDGYNSGQGFLEDGTGPIKLNSVIDTDAIPVEVIPKFLNVLSYSFENELVNLCLNQRNFGLSFNKITRTWNIILDTNLDKLGNFNLQYQGNVDNLSRDSSWLVIFIWSDNSYKVRYRTLDYIFESKQETGFFVDADNINYDFVSNTVIKDQISVLSINTAYTPTEAANTSTFGSLGKDFIWQIDSAVIEPDGYIEPKKVKVSFYNYTESGQIVDPDSFDKIVEPESISNENGFKDKFVYFKKTGTAQRYELVDESEIVSCPTPENVTTTPSTGDLYYFYDDTLNVIKSYDASLEDTGDPWVYQADYIAYPGRAGLKFHYVHNSGENKRIDPSKSNIVDIYLLTSAYDLEYRNWLITGQGTEPSAPTSQGLDQNYSALLDPIKTISDELIFHPVKYKILFGKQANINLQATFKAVRNPLRPTSDNELKSKILSAIQDFFSLENWDFGQSFYFTELSTYVMNLLTPDITNFVIVPKADNNFGSLYEVSCLSNEIFINGANAEDIEIVEAITASQLKTTDIVTTSGT